MTISDAFKGVDESELDYYDKKKFKDAKALYDLKW